MTPQTQTKKIRNAIEPIFEEWGVSVIDRDGCPVESETELFKRELIEAIKPLLPKDNNAGDFWSMTESAAKKIEEQNAMIERVESVLVYDGIEMGGNGKWESAIRYLVKVENEHGWNIETLWAWAEEEGGQGGKYEFKPGFISKGLVMKDPLPQIKAWIKEAHAVQEEALPDLPHMRKFVPEEGNYVPNPYPRKR